MTKSVIAYCLLLLLFVCFSESSLSVLVADDSFVEFFFCEVRPIDVGEVEFGVSYLPEQEVADSEFSAGSDEQVGVRYVTCA